MRLKFQSKSESGNVFLAIFGAIALVGLLGASVMTFMKGPLATSVRLTKINTAENQMQIGSQVAVMATVNQANSGDCDADGYVEPIEWRAATSEPHPVNGGLVPLSLGISKKDPWGTEYGYCVWNHGATTSGSGCNANMLGGTASTSYPVVALISAGPDKAFTTTCRDFATADVTGDGDLADATDLPLVSKAAETDDDIITSFTYQEATGASGGLWNLKTGAPETATIGKNIETTGSARLGGGLLLPDKSLITCDATTAGVMAMNGNAIEMCNGTSWVPITGGSSKLDDETVQTDLMCDSSATGQLRYNTAAGGGSAPAIVQQSPAVFHVYTQTLPAAPTVGNSIVVLVSGGGNGTTACDISGSTTISDSAGNTYTKAVATTDTGVWAMNAGIWIAPVVSTGSGFTVTLTNSTCTDWDTLQPIEVSGINNSSPLDVSAASNSGYEKTITITTPSTTSANAIAFGVYDHPFGYNTMSLSPGWTLIPGGDSGNALHNIYQVLSSTGAVSNTWTADTDAYKPAAIAVFKGSGSGGGGSTKVVEVCNGTSWTEVGSSSGGGGGSGGGTTTAKLDTETVNTDLMCDGTNLGLMRYNTTGTSATDTVTTSGGSGSVSFVGISSGHEPGDGGQSSLTLSIPAPSGVSAGDVLLYALSDDGSGVLTWPPGFTELQREEVGSPDGQRWAIAYKVATGSETNLDVNDDSSWSMSGSVVAYSGVDTTTPINISNKTTAGTSANPWTLTSASMTTTVANTQIVWFAAADTDNDASGWSGSSSCASVVTDYTAPSGFTERADIQGLLNPYTCFNPMAVADNIQAAAGATGVLTGSLTSSGGGAASTGVMLVALNPASGGGGGGTTTVSGSTYAEVCDGTKWVTVGAGFLDHMNDVIVNYTGSTASGKQSTNSMFIGKGVGTTAAAGADGNTAIGVSSMANLSTGQNNTALGTESLSNNTTGSNNTAVGKVAMFENTTGSNNTAIGSLSLRKNTSGDSNTAIGMFALSENTTGSNNIAIGQQAAFLNTTGSHNTVNGSGALYSNTTGSYNTANGSGSLGSNTTANNNTAIGVQALGLNSTGANNTAVGYLTLYGNTTGDGNAALGYQAGQAGTGNVTGNYNTFIGYQAQANADNYTNSTALGNGANITASNQIVLGNTSITEIRAQVTSITAISDKRLKKDIEPSELGLFFIDSLRPVQYRYNNGDNTLRYGFIAQETESVLPDDLKPLVGKESGIALVNHDNDKDQTYHMTYGELTAPIVKAIQELSANLSDFIIKTKETISKIFDHNKEQDTEIESLRAEVERLKLSCDKK